MIRPLSIFLKLLRKLFILIILAWITLVCLIIIAVAIFEVKFGRLLVLRVSSWPRDR